VVAGSSGCPTCLKMKNYKIDEVVLKIYHGKFGTV
jgi:hypothetical protein